MVSALLGFVLLAVLVGLGFLISPTVAIVVFLGLVVLGAVGSVLGARGEP